VCKEEGRKEGRKERKAKSTRPGCGVEGVRLIVLLNKTRGIGSPGTEVKLFSYQMNEFMNP
jgi:hypothetical protein